MMRALHLSVTALLVPILLGVAASLSLPPLLFAAAIAVSACCVFLLPVATPPNATVFATDQVPQLPRCAAASCPTWSASASLP